MTEYRLSNRAALQRTRDYICCFVRPSVGPLVHPLVHNTRVKKCLRCCCCDYVCFCVCGRKVRPCSPVHNLFTCYLLQSLLDVSLSRIEESRKKKGCFVVYVNDDASKILQIHDS